MAADSDSPKPRLNRCRLHSPDPDADFVGSLIVAGGSLHYSFHTHDRRKDRCADELTFVRNHAAVIQLTIIISSRCREVASDQLLTTIRMMTIILIWKTLGSPDSGKMDHRQCLQCRRTDSVSCADRNNNQLSSICAKRRRRNRAVEKAGSVAENHQRWSNASPVDTGISTHGDHSIKCSVLR